jgi:hypothetical protein
MTFRITGLQNELAIKLPLSRQEGVSAFDTHRKLGDVIKTETIAYSIVTRYFREAL